MRSNTAGAAPLTKQRTTALPEASVVEENVAMSLYTGSNGSVVSRGNRSRLVSMSSPALWPSTSRAPSVGSPTTLPFSSLASLVMMYGRMASSIESEVPAACCTCPSRP